MACAARRTRRSAGPKRFSKYRSRSTPPPRRDVGGSKDMAPAAAWSRDDLVPVGFSGHGIDEFALGDPDRGGDRESIPRGDAKGAEKSPEDPKPCTTCGSEGADSYSESCLSWLQVEPERFPWLSSRACRGITAQPEAQAQGHAETFRLRQQGCLRST